MAPQFSHAPLRYLVAAGPAFFPGRTMLIPAPASQELVLEVVVLAACLVDGVKGLTGDEGRDLFVALFGVMAALWLYWL
jgi:hypothetical protein